MIEHGFKTHEGKFFIPLPLIKIQLQVQINEDRTISPSLVSVFALIHLRTIYFDSELKSLFYALQGQNLRKTEDLSYLTSGSSATEGTLKIVQGIVSKEMFDDIQGVIEGFEEASEYKIVEKPKGLFQSDLRHGSITGLWCSAGFVNGEFCGQVFIELTSVQFLRFKYKL